MSSFDSNVGSQYKLVPTNLSELPLTENPSLLELTNELLPLLETVLEAAAARHDTIEVKSQRYEKSFMTTRRTEAAGS
jgi:hypothetical protein